MGRIGPARVRVEATSGGVGSKLSAFESGAARYMRGAPLVVVRSGNVRGGRVTGRGRLRRAWKADVSQRWVKGDGCATNGGRRNWREVGGSRGRRVGSMKETFRRGKEGVRKGSLRL